MNVEQQIEQREPIKFVAVDLYERLSAERAADPAAFERKFSDVMCRTVDGYEQARRRAVESAERKK